MLCLHSLAEERKGCVRPFHDVAAMFADSGLPSLTFDYSGTGESTGEFELVTWQSLLCDCHAALDEVLSITGAKRVWLLAVRLGARLALELAQKNSERISGVCMWQPVVDASSWLRELRRRSKFRGGGCTLDENDVDGYYFAREFADCLSAMEPLESFPGCEKAVVSVGGVSPSRPMAALAEKMGDGIHAVNIQPFWLETDVVESSELVRVTREIILKG